MQRKKTKSKPHIKSRRIYKYLFAILMIFILIACVKEYIQLKSVKITQESISKIDTQLVNIVKSENPRVALEALNKMLSDDRIANACHTLSHDIGHAAYLKYNNFNEALKYKNEICGAGYIHGVIEEWFSLAKNFSEINNKLATVCAPQNLGTCFHGIGHGFMYFSSNDLTFSLSNCDNLLTSDRRNNCYDGVFMENFEGDHVDHPTNFLDPIFPESICRKLASKYKDSCYFYDVRYYLQLHPREYLAAFAWCRTFKDGYKFSCIKGVGSALMKQNLNETSFVEETCSQTADDQEREFCISGMASYYLTNFYSIKAGINMCETLTLIDQKQCLNYMVKEISNFPQ